MNWKLKLGAVLIVLAAFVYAGTEVDQGKPGHYGSWPVSVSSGSLSLSSSVTLDGGYTSVLNTVSVATPSTGGSPASSPNESTAATLDTENITVPSNAVACNTAAGASCTRIYGANDYSYILFQNVAITITNSGANALTNGVIAWSTDLTNLETWDSTTFDGLAAGATLSMQLTGNSRRYLKIYGQSAAGTSTKVTVTANARAF